MFRLFREKYMNIPVASRNLTGRTAIVTGANAGLGFETSLALLRMKPKRLILAVRSLEKGKEAAEKLRSLVSETTTAIDVWNLELDSFASVKEFAAKANVQLDRLDILENAGVWPGDKLLTKDGWELTLQVNVIQTGITSSTAGLALSLLGKMQETSTLPIPPGGVSFRPHLTIVTSDLHSAAKFKEQNEPEILKSVNEKDFTFLESYQRSKLLDILFARELGKRPEAEGITVSAPNPGFSRTELGRYATGGFKLAFGLFASIVAKPAEAGARNIVWGAVEDFESGSYVHTCKIQEGLSTFVASPEGIKAQEKVFRELMMILRAEGFQLSNIPDDLKAGQTLPPSAKVGQKKELALEGVNS
ncbi:NAD(P)-binding protein [Atractiella rhizophila]|nr:NAD(P)-binding protein [Atractiella rhizophila]